MVQLALILDNIRSTHNVGSILRSADGFGVSHIYFAGYTPYPLQPNDTRLPHESSKTTSAIHKTALGAELTQSISIHQTIKEAIFTAREQGYAIASLEQAANSVPLNTYKPPNQVALVLGNEVSGISSDTLAQCDVILELQMFGKKESFNVSVTAAIAMYVMSNSGQGL